MAIALGTEKRLFVTNGLPTHLSALAHQLLALPPTERLPVLEYDDAIALLREYGLPISIGDDLGVRGAERLGQIIRERDQSDAVVIRRFPDVVKKFYTHRNDDGTTETFDLILGGWEIVSGAIRETRVAEIRRRMAISGIDPRRYEFYLLLLDGAPRHGGFGMGFDRLVTKILGIDRVGDAVAFPRTFEQLIP